VERVKEKATNKSEIAIRFVGFFPTFKLRQGGRRLEGHLHKDQRGILLIKEE
jgi:hypothetical protein